MADVAVIIAFEVARVIMRAPLVSFTTFVFIYVFFGMNLLRPMQPRMFPRVYVLQTIGGLLLAGSAVDFLPQFLLLLLSGASFVSSNFILSIQDQGNQPATNPWIVWYRLFGWGGLATCAVSGVLMNRMNGLDVDKEYDLYFQLKLVPLLLNFSMGVFIVNFLVAPEVGEQAMVFFAQFPDHAKAQQSRDIFLLGSLSLPLAIIGGWFGVYITIQAGFLYLFSNLMIHYSAVPRPSRLVTRYLLTWAGFTTCFVSAFLQNLTFKMDVDKVYTQYRSLQFLYGLMNTSLAAIGCFTSVIDVVTQYNLMRGITRKDIRVPAKLATTVGSVLLMSTNLSAYAQLPKSFVVVSSVSSMSFAGSLVLYEFTRQAGRGPRSVEDSVRNIVLATGSLASFISTYCFAYAVFLLDKERSADVVDFVTTIARYSNASLGAVVTFHVLIVENMDPVFNLFKTVIDGIVDVVDVLVNLVVQAYRSVQGAFEYIYGLVYPYLALVATAIRDVFMAIRPFLRRAYAALVAQVVRVYRVVVDLAIEAGRAVYQVGEKVVEVVVVAGATLILWGTAVVEWTVDLARRLNMRYYYEQVLLAVKTAAIQVRDVGVMVAVQLQTALYRMGKYVADAAVVVGEWVYAGYKYVETVVDAVIDRIEAFIFGIAEILRPYVRGLIALLLRGVAYIAYYVAFIGVWTDAAIAAFQNYVQHRIEAVVQAVIGLHELVVDRLDQGLQSIGLSVRVFSVLSGAMMIAASLAIHAQVLSVAACIPLFLTRNQGFLGLSMMLTVPFLYTVPPGTYQYLLPSFINALVGLGLVVIEFEQMLPLAQMDFPLASKVGLNVAAGMLLAALVLSGNSSKVMVLMEAAAVQYGSYLVRRQRDFWRIFAQISCVGSYAAALLFRHSLLTLERNDKYLGLIMNSSAVALTGCLAFSMLYFQLVEVARANI